MALISIANAPHDDSFVRDPRKRVYTPAGVVSPKRACEGGQSAMVDLLIRGGLIIDGSGSPGFRAHVLVDGDRIAIQRGTADGIVARRTIDASARVVCPGFIDLHSHAGFTIFGEPHHDPKVRQGVTTELIGVDGISYAPFRSRAELDRYIWLNAGLNGYPPQAADWLTVGDLLDRYERTVAINVAHILGGSPVRIWSVGWHDRPASEEEVAAMQSVVREAMEAGAWGLSTGLDYPPGSYASTDELVALMEVCGRAGGFYHTHTRSSLRAQGPLLPWQEAVEIGRRSDAPVHLTHYYQPNDSPAGHHAYLELVEGARRDGLDVTFDAYPYPYASTTATILLPDWAKEGGPEGLIQALERPADRARIKDDLSRRPARRGWELGWLTNFTLPDHVQYDGRTVAEIAAMRNQDPVEALADLILAENLGVNWIGGAATEAAIPAFVAHPYGMIASDAILLGAYPSPRTYGCFPHVLGHFVRRERTLTLEEAIRKMTSFPAQRLGLPDRGLLRDGFRADIVIFDAETVHAPASRSAPRQFPQGIEYVIVNGQLVIDQGENTGALPGRALRRGRPAT